MRIQSTAHESLVKQAADGPQCAGVESDMARYCW